MEIIGLWYDHRFAAESSGKQVNKAGFNNHAAKKQIAKIEY
jgi:hypothetical protein